jgi:hypothetical protein
VRAGPTGSLTRKATKVWWADYQQLLFNCSTYFFNLFRDVLDGHRDAFN